MLTLTNFFQPDHESSRDGFRLAALNGVLAVLCVFSFTGTLFLTAALSMWLMSLTGNPLFLIPFPFPLFLFLYAVMFIIAWTWFAGRLPDNRQAQTLKTSFIGATPLFGLSLLGYASVIWTLIFGDFEANQMLDVSVWIYGMISTLILLAAVSCVIWISFIAPKKHRI